jgi:hypothetical protein
MKGHRWVAWDVDFLVKPFGRKLLERLGPAGVVVFLGLVSACKVGRPPGEIRFTSQPDFLRILGLEGLELVDAQGQPWTLETFWRLTAAHKVTRHRRSTGCKQVALTHWEDWQQESMRAADAQRKAIKRSDKPRTGSGQAPDPTATSTTTRSRTSSFSKNGLRAEEEELVDLKAAVAVLKEQMGWGERAQG